MPHQYESPGPFFETRLQEVPRSKDARKSLQSLLTSMSPEAKSSKMSHLIWGFGVPHLVTYFHIPVYTMLLQKAAPCSLARCEYCQRFSCLLPVSPDTVEAEENNTKKSKKSERMEECFTNRAISSGPFCDDRIPLKFHFFWKSVT